MQKVFKIMQGDQYKIPIEIITSDGTPASDGVLQDLEVTIGGITKSLANGEITYNNADKVFEFPITQEETLKLNPVNYNVQIRVKVNDNVVGYDLGKIVVIKSQSKVVL